MAGNLPQLNARLPRAARLVVAARSEGSGGRAGSQPVAVPVKGAATGAQPRQGDDHDPATDHESRGRARLQRRCWIEEVGFRCPAPAGTGEDRSLRRLPHDLHAAEGDWPVKPPLPFIPGHEGVGYVAAVGSGVTRVKEGDRVGIPWLYTACGCCEHCLTGWETLCESQQNTGYSVNGGYAEYVLADPNYVGILPKNVEFAEIAPILCAGVTVYKGAQAD